MLFHYWTEQTRIQLDLVEKAFDARVHENNEPMGNANDAQLDGLVDKSEI